MAHRAPLPHRVLAHLGQRSARAAHPGPHREDPRGLGHHQRDAAGEPPGARRRAGRDARSPEQRSLRVRYRSRFVDHRAGRLRHHRPRAHQRDVRRGDRRVQEDVARPDLLVRRALLLDARAQRAAEAVREAAPADVGRGRQPGHVREGRAARSRRAVLHRWFAREDGAADRALQEEHQERGAGRRVRERQRRGHHQLHVPRGSRRGA